MDVKYRVLDDNDKYYGTYSKLEYALEEAEIVAEDTKRDTFVYKITTELLECVIGK
ncbi:hypothetical protein [Bacillus sp. AG4(2022)]|uniref:hypothetical protein n=1 Tax=Bacillus sp. AG4(2022) TaxID=2962594 RepID=UPI00288275A3|nr:hypothetical protein [Bacillus sp. AG4(2022)]MDT0160449.1 hypothetical protein [Bacillus sp. AG4(2022)]